MRSSNFQPQNYKIVGDSYISSAKDVSVQNTLNMFAVPAVNSLTGDAYLASWPGLKVWSSGIAGEVDRGIYQRIFLGKAWKVSGSKLYSFDKNGTQTEEASISGSGIVSMVDNGTYLAICSAGFLYYYDGTTLTTASLSFNPVQIDYLNNQFIVLDDEGLVHIANVGSQSFSAENVLDPNSSPSQCIAIKVFNQFLFCFDKNSIEPYDNTGEGNPPFERANGAIIEDTGIVNRNAIAMTSEALYFVGDDKKPYQLINFQARHLADQNPGITELFASYYTDNCFLQSVTVNGQDIIIFTFPSDEVVWCYSQQTQLWFQLDHDADKKLYLGKTSSFLFGKTLFGDRTNGNIYSLDSATFQNNATTMIRERVLRPFSGEALGAPRIQMQMKMMAFAVETGVGGSNNEMMVSYSTDGGRSWSNESWIDLGEDGDYLENVEDYNNFKFKDLAVKIRYSDNTRFSLYDSAIWYRVAGR